MTRRLQGPVWLDPWDTEYSFPDPRDALSEPNGLLALGGDLSPGRLLSAYRRGIFPWYTEEQPILWWTPDPRAVLFPEQLKISRSLRKTLRGGTFTVTLDQNFVAVIQACSEPRKDGQGTWLTEEMKNAYLNLHQLGYAHSAESWFEGELVGGLYGIALGRVFFGESMFARRTDASKVAFAHLVRQLQTWDFGLIDCQVASRHLASLGAVEIPREQFMALLENHCKRPSVSGPWQFDEKVAW